MAISQMHQQAQAQALLMKEPILSDAIYDELESRFFMVQEEEAQLKLQNEQNLNKPLSASKLLKEQNKKEKAHLL